MEKSRVMRVKTGTCVLAGGFAVAAWAADRVYQPGKLLNATTESRQKKGNTTTHAVFTVQAGDLVYTVRAEKVGANAKDYTEGMIVGDPVEASVDGNHLYLKTPKGKEIKTDVLTRARAAAAPVQ